LSSANRGAKLVASRAAMQTRPCDPNALTRRFYATSETKTQVVPPMGDSITEGELKSWSKGVGEHVAVDDLVAVIETDKVAVEIRAKEAGVVKEHFAEEGSTVSVGAPLFAYEAGAEAPKKAESAKEEVPKKVEQPSKPEVAPKVAEAPKAAAAPEAKTAPAAPKTETPKAPAQKPSVSAGGERKVKVTRMRERIAQRLKDAQNTYAMLTTFQEADMFNLINMREDFKEEFQKKHGVKLGFMSAFVKASAAALKEIPAVNAVYDGSNREIIYRDYVDISVAVATPRGLVVPVLRDCDHLSFADVEKRLGELSARARKDEITLEEMAGGTFTISNGGVYGSLMGTPIINPPQSAILGMHAINKRPVVVNDQVVIRPIMYLALTYDHRLIDGKEAVTFLRHVKHAIEDPRRLLLDL
jgi:2-oxoglutarate dehydrogenase E2 component (dihydrolipoamide succinyltransferase)